MAPKRKKQNKEQTNDERKKIEFNSSTSYHKHEEELRFSTSYCDTALKIKPQDITQKMMIASNIVVECKKLRSNLTAGKVQELQTKPIMKQLKEYTNLSMDELKTIYDSVITRDRSFPKAIKDVRSIPDPTAGFLADDIRSTFIKYIVELKQFPSKMDFLKDLKVLSGSYSNETIPIQRLAKNKLIKYQHFPEFNRYLLTEHPERVYQRTMYLNSVKAHRLQHKNFVYVEVRRIVPRGTASGFIAGLAAIPSTGILEKFFTKDSTDPIAKKWLQQRIMPLIPENGVVVLAQPKTRNKLTAQGKRFDLINWMDQNGIPYGKNPHTAELYSLFTKFNKGSLMEHGVYDHVFVNADYPLIHFPSEWRQLNFFKSIWEDINVMDAYHPGRPESLKQKILNATALLSKLDETEESLIEEEFKMMQEDRALEDIIENVYEMVKKGEVQTLEFPKDCCGDKTDYFETNVHEILLDVACD